MMAAKVSEGDKGFINAAFGLRLAFFGAAFFVAAFLVAAFFGAAFLVATFLVAAFLLVVAAFFDVFFFVANGSPSSSVSRHSSR